MGRNTLNILTLNQKCDTLILLLLNIARYYQPLLTKGESKYEYYFWRSLLGTCNCSKC